MNRPVALVLCILFFILFTVIAYYGAKITFWSSIIFGIFVSLILLLIFYPISQLTSDDPDFTLYLYAIIVILGFILLAIYIVQKSLGDIRCC
jgi:uncharacterized membrane protein YagU involved in acid resistance